MLTLWVAVGQRRGESGLLFGCPWALEQMGDVQGELSLEWWLREQPNLMGVAGC